MDSTVRPCGPAARGPAVRRPRTQTESRTRGLGSKRVADGSLAKLAVHAANLSEAPAAARHTGTGTAAAQCRRALPAAAALRQLELDGPVRWSAVGIRHGPAGSGGRGPVGPFLVTGRLRLPSESLEDCRPTSASASQLAEPPARAVPGPGRAVRVARSTKGDRMFY